MALLFLLACFAQRGFLDVSAQGCGLNPIACENQLAGSPATEWDIVGAGDPDLQGYATEISVNRGETVRFKIKSDAAAYTIDIYRLGYYGGFGARRVAQIVPTATLPQNQPDCLLNVSGLIDCGNWSESASWAVPSSAVSGIYLARLIRTSTGTASHIVFIVRDDASTSDLIFQTSDTTWQAYNSYGGNSLYVGPGEPAGRALKVSYNRPFNTRAGVTQQDWLFDSEYPTLRWLEANGYDVSYTTGVDSDRRGNLLLNHRVFLSVGHDEYWSGAQRTNVEAARAAGVHMAFLSGNEVFWKTRWEPSIDGSGTAYRTLVSYKETSGTIDNTTNEWTGTWRDPRFSPPADGGRPENALTGQLFTVNAGDASITVPQAFSALRFWRNTAVASLAPGDSYTMPFGTLGYEWDEDVDNGFRPSGLVRLSSTDVSDISKLQDYGSTYAPGSATHSLTLYRHASGALVFGAGTVRWGWGLDSTHDGPAAPSDGVMRQATVNLLADMQVQPQTLQPPLSPAVGSADALAPTSAVTFPGAGSSIAANSLITISGTATDAGGGAVAAVDVSTDGGTTWKRANGMGSWTYQWTAPATPGAVTIRSRAVDDSGHIETPSAGVTINVVAASACPCSLWSASDVPQRIEISDGNAIEVGVKFRSSVTGYISGIRFYKGATNTGEHNGNLWTAGGTLLATATFTNETASGWQQVNFSTPVPITQNVTYVASYHTTAGNYGVTNPYFATARSNPPLVAPDDASSGGNGVYKYGSSGFPSDSFGASNYWVDVVFKTTLAADTTPPTVVSVNPAEGATAVPTNSAVTVTFNEAMNPQTIGASTLRVLDPAQNPVAAAVTWDAGSLTATIRPNTNLNVNTLYSVRVVGGSADPRAKDEAGNPLAANFTSTFRTAATHPPTVTCPCTIWTPADAPASFENTDTSAVELGVRFRSDISGFITGVRFYKNSADLGAHIANLWSNTGTLLASVPYLNETGSGWQQVEFASPVAIAANTTYVVSYHLDAGRYAADGNYFLSSGVDNGNLHALPNDAGGNGVYVYGASAFPNQSYGATNYWVDVVFVNALPPDTAPPVVIAVTPPHNSANVDPRASVNVRFDEPLDPATVNTTNVQLLDSAFAVVPAGVSYNNSTRTATLTPSAQLAFSASYSVLVRGGPTGVKDPAGNALAANFLSSFTTAATLPAGPVCPCTIFDPAATPSSLDTDALAVELGVKFQSTTAGYITGVRFYKGTPSAGSHVGNLWTSSGTRLASAVFTNETPTGWQDVVFNPAVAITANTTYVASYHASAGRYVVDSNYFVNAVTRGPLTALSSGSSGGNGVYRYGASAFPNSTFQAGNYWVDVVFDTILPVDNTPPTVTVVSPSNGAANVQAAAQMTATMSEAINPASLTTSTFVLRNAATDAIIPSSVVYNSLSKSARLIPAQPLPLSTTFTATLVGGAAGIADLAGNRLATNYVWTFSSASAAPLPPDQGPGGPILIVNNPANKFSTYLAEILRMEGLTEFAIADLSTVTAPLLTQYDVVVLGETPTSGPQALTAAQVTLFTDWVTAGGNLIAMRPDKQLATLLGLTDAASTLANAYLLVNTSATPGLGIVADTMQFHGTADRYTLNGAAAIATLYTTASTASANPAVTMRSVGANGGQAVAFTFDLARSVVYTRQGNPAWVGQDRDGIFPARSDDLFFGNAAGDPQPDWIDLNKIAIPQADEQQRLLANIILETNKDRKPLPRFWYLPNGLKAAVVYTGDDHDHGGTFGRIQQFKMLSTPGCDPSSWSPSCPRLTSYMFNNTPISDADAAQFNDEGFELALHPSVTSAFNCADFTQASLDTVFTAQLQIFQNTWPSLPAPATNRTHCVPWSDWASQAKVSLTHGIRFDTNYYHFPASWVGGKPGFLYGTGMPMRFADVDGQMIDVYQSPTHFTDESGQAYPATAAAVLGSALGPQGFYGFFGANMHTDLPTIPDSDELLNWIYDPVTPRNVAVVSSRQTMDFLDGRGSSRFSNITWSNTTLSFTVAVGAGASGLQGMVPANSVVGRITGMTRNGNPISFTTETIKGIEYAFFSAIVGQYDVVYAVDLTAPVISNVAAAPQADGNVAVTWTTDSLATSRVDYGTSPSSLTLNATTAGVATSHSVTLSGVQSGITYYYRVTSADESNNVAVAPAPPDAPLTIMIPPPIMTVNNVSLSEGNSGTTPYVFQMTLSRASSLPVSIDVATANGSALAGVHYVATSGTVVIPPGSTTGTVTVQVLTNTVFDPDSFFLLNLINITNAVPASLQATGTILNDDPVPMLNIDDVRVLGSATQSVNAIFTVTLAPPQTRAVSVNYATADVTAIAGTDYTATSGTLNFPIGSVSQTITVPILADPVGAGMPTYVVNLSNAVNALVADGQGLGTIVKSFTDTTTADFMSGTIDAGAHVSAADGGQVTLASAVSEEFHGPGLPAGWAMLNNWQSTGSATVSGGRLLVNGAMAGPTALFTPGRSLEFVATFSPDAFGHVGFAVDFDQALRWAIFSTAGGDGNLYARSKPSSGGETLTSLGPGLLNTPHLYRIDWNGTDIAYSIDGAVVAVHPVAIPESMRPVASLFGLGTALAVERVRLSPYVSPGSFVSRVVDAQQVVPWGAIEWDATVPANTAMVVEVRTGDTAVPDGSWTAFATLPASGTAVNASSRYIQYRVTMSTSDPTQSPVLRLVRITFQN